jgi:hypothetical protein
MLGLVTYSLILFTLAIGVWLRPTVGVAAVLCLYGLKQWGQSTTSFFYEHAQFTNYAVFILAMIGLVRAAQRRSCVFCGFPPTTMLVVALYLYSFISITWTPDVGASLDQWAAQGPYILTVALLAPLLFTDFEGTRAAFTWTAVTGAAICILALAFGKWADRGLVLYGHEAIQEYQTNPLAMASMAGTVALISAMWFGRPNGAGMRILSMAFIPIAIAVILRSAARGQLIATGAGLIVALPISLRIKSGRSIAALMLAAVMVIGLGMVASSFIEIDSTRWGSKQSTEDVTGRLANAEALLQASASSFSSTIFGLGNSSAFKIIGFYPHIAGLEVIAEEGLIGAGIYFTILLFAVRSIVRIAGQPQLSDLRRNVLATLSGLFVFEFILSWKQGSLLSSVYVFAYAITLARLETPIDGRSRMIEQSGVSHDPAAPTFQNLLR